MPRKVPEGYMKAVYPVKVTTHERVVKLARKRGVPIGDVVEVALKEYTKAATSRAAEGANNKRGNKQTV